MRALGQQLASVLGRRRLRRSARVVGVAALMSIRSSRSRSQRPPPTRRQRMLHAALGGVLGGLMVLVPLSLLGFPVDWSLVALGAASVALVAYFLGAALLWGLPELLSWWV